MGTTGQIRAKCIASSLEDDFAEGSPVKMVERGCKFGKSIAPISYRLESSPIHVGGEILQRPPVADAYAVDSHILEHQLTNGRRQVKPAKDADLIDAPTNGCYLNCLAEIRASYKFEDVIDAS